MGTLSLDNNLIANDLVRSTDVVARIEKSLPFTWIEYKNFCKSVEELRQLQIDEHSSLCDTKVALDHVAETDPARLSDTLGTDGYKALYQYRDYLNERMGLFRRINRNTRKFDHIRKAFVLWVFNFYMTMKVRSVNGKNIKLAKQQLKQLDMILGSLDAYNRPELSIDDFVELSANTLWNDRCKAYDYLA